MDVTDNKYIKYVFDELSRIPGLRYSSMLHRKINFDKNISQKDKNMIEIAIALLVMNQYLEEKGGHTSIMNMVMATVDKGNKVIEYGKRVVIQTDLLHLLPYSEEKGYRAKLLYDLTGDKDSIFYASDSSIKEAISEACIQLPQTLSERIDIYEYIIQHTTQQEYEKFLNALSKNIEKQNHVSDIPTSEYAAAQPVTNINISNPILIENMSNSNINATDKSKVKNISVNGDSNQVITDSKNTHIGNQIEPNNTHHWLEILYWIVGIAVALITIYNLFIK